MNLPYFSHLRRGMPKPLQQRQELYDATVRWVVLAGLGFGALMVVVQLIRWAL